MRAQPLTPVRLVDPSSQTGFTQTGIQHFNQWQKTINAIPISVSGENVAGAGKSWMLANLPAANVSLVGITADGPIPLSKGSGKSWNYTIDGQAITTAQAFEEVIASYEFNQ